MDTSLTLHYRASLRPCLAPTSRTARRRPSHLAHQLGRPVPQPLSSPSWHHLRASTPTPGHLPARLTSWRSSPGEHRSIIPPSARPRPLTSSHRHTLQSLLGPVSPPTAPPPPPRQFPSRPLGSAQTLSLAPQLDCSPDHQTTHQLLYLSQRSPSAGHQPIHKLASQLAQWSTPILISDSTHLSTSLQPPT